MVAQNGSLTPKQALFVAALMSGQTITVAGKAASISERTAARWMKETAILDALKASRRELYATSMQALTALVDDAIALLKTALSDKKAGYTVRLRAAQLVLEHAHLQVIDEEIEMRIAALESTN